MRNPGADACADRITGTDRRPECNAAAQARPSHACADTLANADRKPDPEPNTDAHTVTAVDLYAGWHEDRDSSRGMHPRKDTLSEAERIALAASDTADDRLTKHAGDRIAKRCSILVGARNSTTIGVVHDTRGVTDEDGAPARMKN